MFLDMAQADRKLYTNRHQPQKYGWTEISIPESLSRGDLCVIRCDLGSPRIIKIDPQEDYKMWVGSFSLI